jgi:hypothetical protein
MAVFKGTAGDFLSERALNRRLRAVLILIACLVVFMFFVGVLTGYQWTKSGLLRWVPVGLAAVGTVVGLTTIGKWFDRQVRQARFEENGASGEREILDYLKQLPDTFTVISDIDFADSYGNIDHLVIGPSGVFAIDVKDWRGTVAPDGRGELLYNGKPTEKPVVRQFTRRAMDLKDRLKALTKLDPYVQCVFAFVRTRVDANWGSTGYVHCIRVDQIAEYIAGGKGSRAVSSDDIPVLVSASTALKETLAKAKQVA